MHGSTQTGRRRQREVSDPEGLKPACDRRWGYGVRPAGSDTCRSGELNKTPGEALMTAAPFDLGPLLAPGVPPPAPKWTGYPRYNFVGGHNDPEHVPLPELIAAANAVLQREGRDLALYTLQSGPLGYRHLREFLARKLARHAGIACDPEQILITSGSLQAMDLVNTLLLSRGDTVLVEQANYGGTLSRLARLGVNAVGIPLDADGMRMDALADALQDLAARGIRPKYLY